MIDTNLLSSQIIAGMNLSADIICDIIDVSSATANVPVTGNYLTFAVHRRALVARDTINQKKTSLMLLSAY